ncbi:cupin domain-containing protein [Phytohabitans flavus]|uniref:cupin domain-containing protein n=1 Tax=Phytohabitans flavus TaxID=1076124 RepID=UPI00363B0C4A
MTSRHVVRRASEAAFTAVSGGFARWSIVDESVLGAVHTGFAVCELAPGASVPSQVNWYEESVFLLSGSAVMDTPGGSYRLEPGDYGLVNTGVPYAWRNLGDEPARWAQMQAPQPRGRLDGDTLPVALAAPDRCCRWTPATRVPSRSATSRRSTWTRASRARTCSRSRPACVPRCSSTAASR